MHPLIGVLLFFTGGGLGYYVGHSVGKIKSQMKYTEELAALEQYYIGKHPEKEPRNADKSSSSEAQIDGEIQSIDCEYKKPIKVDYANFYKSGSEQVDPAEYESPPDDEEDIHDRDVGEFISDYNERHRNDPPRPIKAEECGTMEDYGYTTMELTYYQGNDILVVSEQEGKIEDVIYPQEVDDWVGNSLVKFGFKYNNDEVLYVRNYMRMTDYEIHKKKGSFGED